MNHMVYIAKSIQDRFKREPNKSGLINQLLEEHYRTGTQLLPDIPVVPNRGFSDVPVKREKAVELCPHNFPYATCPDVRCTKKARDKGIL